MKAKINFLEKNYSNFVNSFRGINLNTAFMMFYDLLLYLISGLLINFTLKNLEKKASAVNLPADFFALNAQQAEAALSGVRAFFFTLIFTFIFLVLALILLWSLFKGLNWSIAVKKKINLKYLLRFSLLNIVWLGFWILLLIFIVISISPDVMPIFFLIMLAIAIYFTNILYVLFTQEDKIKAVKKAFKIGFAKIHYFVLPYVVMILIFYVISIILRQFNFQYRVSLIYRFWYLLYLLSGQGFRAGSIILTLAFTVVIAWTRLYIVEVVNSINKK